MKVSGINNFSPNSISCSRQHQSLVLPRVETAQEEKLERYSLYEKLNKIDENLQKYKFIRIHQSYLVNMKHIVSIRNYKALLDNNEELPMSKAKFKEAKEAFIEYKGEL